MTIQGWPRVTISRGRVIYREGKFTGEKSWGRFIPRYYGEAGK
jgi:dihydropyrimidinase